MPCDAALLADVELFEHLSEDDRIRIAPVIAVRRLEPGQVLFHTGEPGEALYIVRSGEIELYVRDTTGQKVLLTTAGAGQMFGELALLDRGPRTATAQALGEAELLELDRDDLIELFKRSPTAALSMLAGMSRMTRQADELLRTRVSRNLNAEIVDKISLLDRVADAISWFSGSMPFLFLNAAIFAVWIFINSVQVGVAFFDPYPFGLLTMAMSIEAIFLSCFVLISQNRQAEKDRVRADIEYEVNIKAELEVAHLHEKTDQIYAEMLERLNRLERLLKQPAR
ncbi:MAG: DUF1003 domain-containing protein [Xanthomonadales bacterium]|nr:DUF1003 domain-containing protein [Xanthomonadales bacterium]